MDWNVSHCSSIYRNLLAVAECCVIKLKWISDGVNEELLKETVKHKKWLVEYQRNQKQSKQWPGQDPLTASGKP